MKLALVIGSAQCMWDDVAEARKLTKFDKVYCVKRVGLSWPERFDSWVGLHPEYMEDWVKQRKAKGLPDGYEIVAPLQGELDPEKQRTVLKSKLKIRRVSYRWPKMNASASSGVYGAKVAMDDGYRVVLAGIPMDKQPHFDKTHHRCGAGPWFYVDSFLQGFKFATPYLKGKVKSMSGHTRDVLGAPTEEWINNLDGH